MKPKKDLNMKKLFRRNQVIITALAVMIAAAGYLNYAGKQELAAGSQVYEAGILEISDEGGGHVNVAVRISGLQRRKTPFAVFITKLLIDTNLPVRKINITPS